MATVHFSLLAQKELQGLVELDNLKFVKLIVHADGDVCFNEAVCFDDFNDFVFILKKMEKALSKLRDLLNSELNDKRNVSRTIVNVVNTTVRCKKGVSESFMSVFSRISCYEDVKYFFLVALRAEIMKGEHNEKFLKNFFDLLKAVPAPKVENRELLFSYEEAMSLHNEMCYSATLHIFSQCWVNFIRNKLPPSLHCECLLWIDMHILAVVDCPLYFTDFVISSFAMGFPLNAAALGSLKHLILICNMHLPTYLVAAFIKKLSRLSLRAPLDSCIILLGLIRNWLIRHPACQILVNRQDEQLQIKNDPYNMDELNPQLSNAMESFLWEIKTLKNHYNEEVANMANFVDQLLPSKEVPLKMESAVERVFNKSLLRFDGDLAALNKLKEWFRSCFEISFDYKIFMKRDTREVLLFFRNMDQENEFIKKGEMPNFAQNPADVDKAELLTSGNTVHILYNSEDEEVSESTWETLHGQIDSLPFLEQQSWQKNDFEFSCMKQSIEQAVSNGFFPVRLPGRSFGSYLVLDEEKNHVGIFKPKDEEEYATRNPSWMGYFQKMFRLRCPRRGCILANQAYLSEVGASIVDEYLDLKIVPKTKVAYLASPTFNYSSAEKRKAEQQRERISGVNLPDKVGSLQCVVEGFQPCTFWLKEFASKKLLDNKLQYELQLLFERVIILDYIIRNTNRTAENLLISYNDTKRGNENYAINMAAVDNRYAFPYRHPRRRRPYTYYWATLPLAKKPFSNETRSFILRKLNDMNYMSSLFLQLKRLFELDENFDKNYFMLQIMLMHGQIFNLKMALENRETPYELVKRRPVYIVPHPDDFTLPAGFLTDKLLQWLKRKYRK
ncbi:Phosphatidylinositol 4-kinase type 2-beta [Trichinella patagoniensis]|uniref:Phosphatidylinositol 4-kinase type 2 n=1 Tax=Trichinella patagoniensis TaxID=990121 RepID=A0A0V0Z6C3_9BILA|nr:Phosphatidylinositol 4-kinase type 2-beta [Trichinella patagoniensis]